jgi:hypothetical protein
MRGIKKLAIILGSFEKVEIYSTHPLASSGEGHK